MFSTASVADSEPLIYCFILWMTELIQIVARALQEKKEKNNKQSSHKNKSVFPVV
jgi:hypothetical protein